MHWWHMMVQRFGTPALMERMFDRFNVSAVLAERAGGDATLERAAARCHGCRDKHACAAWLDLNTEPASPPNFCENARLIARIQNGKTPVH